jgi:hypothetical protein
MNNEYESNRAVVAVTTMVMCSESFPFLDSFLMFFSRENECNPDFNQKRNLETRP